MSSQYISGLKTGTLFKFQASQEEWYMLLPSKVEFTFFCLGTGLVYRYPLRCMIDNVTSHDVFLLLE